MTTTPHPIPVTTLEDLAPFLAPGDTITAPPCVYPLRVLQLHEHPGWNATVVRAACRLPDGVNEACRDLLVINGTLLTVDAFARGPVYQPVRVHRDSQARQLAMFGEIA